MTIIGGGNMGGGIRARLVVGGHGVELLDRSRDDVRTLADEFVGTARAFETIDSDVVGLAFPYDAVEQQP